MAKYNIFPKEVPVNEGTVEGGTLAEWLAKETVEPTNPSLTPLIKTTAVAGKKVEPKGFVVPGALATDLAGGGKITAATLHVSMKTGSAGLRLKFGFVTAAVFTEPSVTTAQAWYTVSLSTAQAEALTKTGLEELLVLAEKLTSTGANSYYEVYLSLETEAGKKTVEEAMSARTGAIATTAARKVATGAASALAGALASATAVKVATGATAAVTGARAFTSSRLVATGAMRAVTGSVVSITVSGRKVVEGSMSAVAGAIITAPAVKVATGAVSARTGAVASITAKRAVQGALTATTGARLVAPGRKVAVGQAQAVTGARLSTVTSAKFAGAMRAITGARLILSEPVPPPPTALRLGPLSYGVDVGIRLGTDLGPTTGVAR